MSPDLSRRLGRIAPWLREVLGGAKWSALLLDDPYAFGNMGASIQQVVIKIEQDLGYEDFEIGELDEAGPGRGSETEDDA